MVDYHAGIIIELIIVNSQQIFNIEVLMARLACNQWKENIPHFYNVKGQVQ